MDRGDWQAAIYGITRIRHDLSTKHATSKLPSHSLVKNIKREIGNSVDFSGRRLSDYKNKPNAKNNIPLYGYATVGLSIHLLKEIFVASKYEQL